MNRVYWLPRNSHQVYLVIVINDGICHHSVTFELDFDQPRTLPHWHPAEVIDLHHWQNPEQR